MQYDDEYGRILSVLGRITEAASKIDDYASKTDILASIVRIYSSIGQKTKNPGLVDLALSNADRIVYDYRRVHEQVQIARSLHRLGRKIQAVNLLWRAENDVKKIKDLTLKVDSMVDINAMFMELGEQEAFEEGMARTINLIDGITGSSMIKADCYLKVFSFYKQNKFEKEAANIHEKIIQVLEDAEPAFKGDIIRVITNTFVDLSRRLPKERRDILEEAMSLLASNGGVQGVEKIQGNLLKECFSDADARWLADNMERIIGIIDSMENTRVKLDVIHDFLVKARKERIEMDQEYVEQLLDLLSSMQVRRTSPSRYISFQLKKIALTGIFISEEEYFEKLVKLVNKVLHDPQFRKNLPERVLQVLQNPIELFEIKQSDDTTILEKAKELVALYALREIKDVLMAKISRAITSFGLRTKDTAIIEENIDYTKKIESNEQKIPALMEIGEALYLLGNKIYAGDMIAGCVDEIKNVKDPRTRISGKLQLSRILMERTRDFGQALDLLEDAFNDADLYAIGTVDKTIAFQEIATRARDAYLFIFRLEETSRRNQYNNLLAEAKEKLRKKDRKAMEEAIVLYEKARNFLDPNMDRYEILWIEDQLDRLRNLLKDFTEAGEFRIPEKELEERPSRDMYRVKKSDIECKHQATWLKKRELVYQVQVTNNSRVQVSELTCLIKKHAREFLELMHGDVQKTPMLKPGGTFTCEFNFQVKRDIYPINAIEAEINFFDPVSETLNTITLQAPSPGQPFRFFSPKSMSPAKFDRVKNRLEKKSDEISVPLNSIVAWKQVLENIKRLPFKVVQKDSNEIANQFFGVIRLYAESRWARLRKNATAIQVVMSGDLGEDETTIKLEFFLQDPLIFYNLLKVFEKEITRFNCPNPGCDATLDLTQVRDGMPGICKACSTMFITDAQPRKIDRPVKFKVVNVENLVNDDKSITMLANKLESMKKEDLDNFLERLGDAEAGNYRKLMERLTSGDIKPRDVIANVIKDGQEPFIKYVLMA